MAMTPMEQDQTTQFGSGVSSSVSLAPNTNTTVTISITTKTGYKPMYAFYQGFLGNVNWETVMAVQPVAPVQANNTVSFVVRNLDSVQVPGNVRCIVVYIKE